MKNIIQIISTLRSGKVSIKYRVLPIIKHSQKGYKVVSDNTQKGGDKHEKWIQKSSLMIVKTSFNQSSSFISFYVNCPEDEILMGLKMITLQCEKTVDSFLKEVSNLQKCKLTLNDPHFLTQITSIDIPSKVSTTQDHSGDIQIEFEVSQ